MAIKLFVFISLIISTLSLFIHNKNVETDDYKADKPIISFIDSTMYTFDNQYITKFVQSKEAHRYSYKDEMFQATVILRDKKNGIDKIDVINSNYILKQNSMMNFKKNVKFNRDNYMTLNTDELFYNMDSKVAYNYDNFTGTYNSHKFNGKDFYLSQNDTIFSADSIHFEIDMKTKE